MTEYISGVYNEACSNIAEQFDGLRLSITNDLATILNSTRSFMVISAHMLGRKRRFCMTFKVSTNQNNLFIIIF